MASRIHPRAEELSRHTVMQLRAMARELQIKGRSRMRKKELVAALARHERAELETTTPPGSKQAHQPTEPAAAVRTAANRERAGRSAAPGQSKKASRPRAEPSRRRTTSPKPSPTGARPAPSPPPASSLSPSLDPSASTEVSGTPRGARRARSERSASDRLENAVAFAPLKDHLCLVAVNPRRAYVFWDVDTKTASDFCSRLGSDCARLQLRVYGAASGDPTSHTESAPPPASHPVEEFDVDSPAGALYLELAAPGSSIFCELGLRANDGGFHSLAASNRIVLPGLGYEHKEVQRAVNTSDSHLWKPRCAPSSTPSDHVTLASTANADARSSGTPATPPANSVAEEPLGWRAASRSSVPDAEGAPPRKPPDRLVVGISSGELTAGHEIAAQRQGESSSDLVNRS